MGFYGFFASSEQCLEAIVLQGMKRVVRENPAADLFSKALNLGLIRFVEVKSLGELDENDPWSVRSHRRANLFSQFLNDLIA